MMRVKLLSTTMLAGLAIIGAALPAMAAEKEFIKLDMPQGSSLVRANAVSTDGKVVVGKLLNGGHTTGFRWTKEGVKALPFLGSGNFAFASAVSANGEVVVGQATIDFNHMRAVRWKNGAIENLGSLDNSGPISQAYGVSGDGKVVVGDFKDPTASNLQRAFRWSEAGTAMVSLGTIGSVTSATSSARATNSNGNVVVGENVNGSVTEAFRWVKDIGAETGWMEGLGFLSDREESKARGVSADGTKVAGYAVDDLGLDQNDNPILRSRAFRWVEGTGATFDKMTSLGALGEQEDSLAMAISADGKVVVGYSVPHNTSQISDRDAFRWSAADSKMISVKQWLTDSGVDVGNYKLLEATGVNADGSVIVGYLLNGATYEAYLATDGGLMLPENFQASLSQVTGADIGIRTGEISLNGAHGKPMRSLLDEGKSSFFAAGDIGRVLQDDGDGYMGFGELGYGRGISDVLTARVAIGGFGERIEPETGGNATSRLAYVLPEFSYNASGNLYITASGYYGRGEVKTHRGYLNGAATDYSDGTADLDVWAGRIRADLKDVFTLDGTAFTPFASYSVIHSHRDAYTETGGAFPVVWDAHSDVSNVVRAGLDATHALTPAVTLLGHVEANYGFEGKTASASGTVIGLNGFETSQASLEQFGAQAGVGFEVQAGSGTASLMLNAATGGNNPAAWLAASYKVTF